MHRANGNKINTSGRLSRQQATSVCLRCTASDTPPRSSLKPRLVIVNPTIVNGVSVAMIGVLAIMHRTEAEMYSKKKTAAKVTRHNSKEHLDEIRLEVHWKYPGLIKHDKLVMFRVFVKNRNHGNLPRYERHVHG